MGCTISDQRIKLVSQGRCDGFNSAECPNPAVMSIFVLHLFNSFFVSDPNVEISEADAEDTESWRHYLPPLPPMPSLPVSVTSYLSRAEPNPRTECSTRATQSPTLTSQSSTDMSRTQSSTDMSRTQSSTNMTRIQSPTSGSTASVTSTFSRDSRFSRPKPLKNRSKQRQGQCNFCDDGLMPVVQGTLFVKPSREIMVIPLECVPIPQSLRCPKTTFLRRELQELNAIKVMKDKQEADEKRKKLERARALRLSYRATPSSSTSPTSSSSTSTSTSSNGNETSKSREASISRGSKVTAHKTKDDRSASGLPNAKKGKREVLDGDESSSSSSDDERSDSSSADSDTSDEEPLDVSCKRLMAKSNGVHTSKNGKRKKRSANNVRRNMSATDRRSMSSASASSASSNTSSSASSASARARAGVAEEIELKYACQLWPSSLEELSKKFLPVY